ncbi:AAA family ATPase [Balneolaceae bacterium YR4-1]|uniref:non-specific serine/threonine protein kinase n=1 Tax=Halalkalibaculum roseum TaxID=2709311 RepID=A0A6M1SJ55_9BACT|nr:ATPase domain-containing protein [Halalkalibaculum roseum]NGP75351.1 AAA family ATPase [Halalkalibaculum roseum]
MKEKNKVSSGVAGLDEILKGGFLPQKSYLIKGGPGTGKSTLGYHFLDKALKDGAEVLYITLGETRENIIENGSQLGIDLSDAHFLDLSPGEDVYRNSKTYSVFSPVEVEQEPMIQSIVEAVEKYSPSCVFLDSITMLQSLNQDPFQMRNMALSFIQFVCNKGATLLITSEAHDQASDKEATFWVDGIIHLEYSLDWRRVTVSKYRGSDFLHGNHAFKIDERGVTVYPRLRPGNYERNFQSDPISTGINELDELLHGGLERGTVSIISGPTGVGKTNFGIQFAKEAASRGDRSAVYTFEESADVLAKRSESIGVPVKSMIENGNLTITSVEPLSYSPDEFAALVRSDIEENDTKIVIIDSVGGYSLSVREENTLERLHSLTVFLQNMGVTTLLIHETANVTGQFETTGMNASYLADNIIFLRYLELNGELRKAIGVLKKRMSDFERSIREFDITKDGLRVGGKLTKLRGILTGLPENTQ